ncbi:MAG: M28 family peptidase [Pseudomonadota bacterium]
MRAKSRWLWTTLCGAFCFAALACAALPSQGAAQTPTPPGTPTWQGARALEDITRIVALGARAPGAPGHDRAIAMIQDEFQRVGVPVSAQTWTVRTPNGSRTYTNLVARLNPEARRRVIAGTHYDSIIRAYADPRSPNGYMPGANNSASGVAVLLETARAIQASERKPNVGVDFIFFDGEEGPLALGAGDPNWHAVGSPYFAAHVSDYYPDGLPQSAAIFDMVCYRNLRLPQELGSLLKAPEQTRAFWSIGSRIAPAVFNVPDRPISIFDDQDALNAVGIPSFLVIGFNYDPWFNTTHDTPDKCSAAALQAVGDTLMGYIYTQ